MERLHCPTCANEVFFDSMRCVRCSTELALEIAASGAITVADTTTGGQCAMRNAWRCNWQPDPTSPTGLCTSCAIVDAGTHSDSALIVAFLAAQRRALWQLTELGVSWTGDPALRFAYRATSAGDNATIGHLNGTITLDLDEADPARGEAVRATLGEWYRTPLGHVRHELGHYVWLRYVAADPDRLAEFRSVFGDETVPYQAALDAHYGRTDDGSWRDEYVSFYASSHPWEDFAESWAHVMHLHDVVSTGAAWGIAAAPTPTFEPGEWIPAAITASLAANELARAMGMRDLYPFALRAGARNRIATCWQLVHG